MRLRSCIVLAVLAVVFVSAPVLAANHTVEIILTSFSPATLLIQTGDTVTWVNNSFLQHTVTSGTNCSPNGQFASPLLDPGDSFVRTFNSIGTFPYFCIPHCLAAMRGTITVDAPVPVASRTWGAIKALYAAGVTP